MDRQDADTAATALPAPKLVFSDIDGTLLNSKDRVIPRLREVISRATHAGVEVALATGRPHRWIHMVLEQLPIRPVCVTSNGAVLYDSARDEVITSHLLAPEVIAHVFEVADRVFADRGGVAVAAERPGESSSDIAEEIFVVSPGYVNTWEEQGFGIASATEIASTPAVKAILRNDSMMAAEMYGLLAPHIDPEVAHLTYSMDAGLLEVAAPGVTKALGVADLARMHDVDQADTIAFGDMPNDIEMLRWVGRGVAMGNAAAPVKEVADEVTATNDEGGVADVLERWF